MTAHDEAPRFVAWLDGDRAERAGVNVAEMRVVRILEDARREFDPSNAGDDPGPAPAFAESLRRRLEIVADTGGVFAAESKLGAAARVRDAYPIGLPGPGVAYRGPSRPGDTGRVRTRRVRHPVVAMAAVLLLLGTLSTPIVREFVASVSLSRSAQVVEAGSDAMRLDGDAWISVKVGDFVRAGQAVQTGESRLVLRLADESVVRMDTATYGTLSLHSRDASIEIGEGRVYVEVNSSGAVNVLVDGVTIAGHGPGSSYSVDAGGLIIVTEGEATAAGEDGRQTNIPKNQRYLDGAVAPVAREGDDSEWLDWNRAGGRNVGEPRG